MPKMMAREEGHPPSAQRAEQIGARRIPERRLERDVFAVGHAGHVVQAAAADDADLNSMHVWLVVGSW
jgi:hypothetical protein